MTIGHLETPGVHRTAFEAADPLPLVFDSPHSGTDLPAGFGAAAPLAILREAEDTHVDTLFAAAPEHRATLIAARFPRAFVDVNRAPDDIDAELLAEPWPGPFRPSVRTERGIGLIRRLVVPGQPIYDRKLPVAEIEARLTRYYRPYHDHLDETLSALQRRFGAVWHVDCHSMKSVGNATTPDGERRRTDLVIGDLHGRSCEAAFTERAVLAFARRGYSAAVNDPYAGAYILERHGRPAEGRHALQIEFNRALYMDERTREPTAGFDRLRADVTAAIGELAAYVEEAVGAGR
ncbi:MAG: N-formylglutamate amidohydrolase [Inquilinus sp.]|nr:N-formylglutamate amidohydrolase [Inquilinus sp.]